MNAKRLIKICGITSLTIAEVCIAHRVDFIGLVFYPPSKRNVHSIDLAQELASTARANKVTPVAVFVDADAAEMAKICQMTAIRIVQLHGSMSRKAHKALPETIARIYAIPVNAQGQWLVEEEDFLAYLDPARDYLLFDHTAMGSGQTFNWQAFTPPQGWRWFLAGGLSPVNVQAALDLLNPTGVDVSSGVEDELGYKTPKLIREFIQQVRAREHGTTK